MPSLTQPKFYVYALVNPAKNDEIFYIGKGSGNRVRLHYTFEMKRYPNSYKTCIIKSYRARGFNDKYVKLHDNLTKQEAINIEVELIAKYGRKIDGSGTLANIALGGEGGNGYRGSLHPIHKRTQNGSNPFSGVSPWNNFKASEKTKLIWSDADTLYSIYCEDKSLGYVNFSKRVRQEFPDYDNIRPLSNMLKKFNTGWNPNIDTQWLTFKENCP